MTTLMTMFHLGSVFKIGFLVIIALFIVFLLVILKQVKSMNRVVTQPYLFPILHVIAWVLVLFGLGLFLISIVIL